MHLSQLLAGICCEVKGNADIYIDEISCNSENIVQNSLFICLKGLKTNGHIYAAQAVEKGAVALLVEHHLEGINATQIVVNNTRKTMPVVAKNFYECACDGLKIIAVTGTNGKTSTTYLLESIFSQAGYRTAIVGTNGITINGKRYDNNLTTPDPIDLHKAFKKMLDEKVKYVFMESTAHAIKLCKLEGVRAEAAVFTNFSQDHLDFFDTLEQYANTKESFFTKKYAKIAVINSDDHLGRQIANKCKLPVLTYGITNPADVFAVNCLETKQGIGYTINLYDEVKEVSYALYGKFNIYNTLAASACARLFGIKLDTICKGLSKVISIQGRNETFYRKDGLKVVVDFAHTPDGMENILSHLKENCREKLFVVFGCGGERDVFKRPKMGTIAGKYGNFVILTDDNPRGEDGDKIISDIECGLNKNYCVIRSRKDAIRYALSLAKSSDTVAVLGKGAEQYQYYKDKTLPYSDLEFVSRLLCHQPNPSTKN